MFNKTKISYFVFHQANKFILKNLQKKLKIPDQRIIIDVKNIGNTVSGSIPIALNRNLQKIKSGKYALLVGFGVGLSISAVIVNLRKTKIFKIIKL